MRRIKNGIKRWLQHVLIFVRRHLRRIEEKLDKKQLHPAVGVGSMILSVLIVIAGIIMLFTPGQGVLSIALGIALWVVGRKIFRREYGPERKKREMEKKIAEIEKREADRARRKQEGKRPRFTIMIDYSSESEQQDAAGDPNEE